MNHDQPKDRIHLTVHEGDRITPVLASRGDTLLSALRAKGFGITAPCGGNGTCGKCRVRILGGPPLPPPDALEHRLLGAHAAEGERLACRIRLEGDLEIALPRHGTAVIVTDGWLPSAALEPLAVAEEIALPPPALGDQRPDDRRFFDETGCSVPPGLLRELPLRLRRDGFRIGYVYRSDNRDVIRFLAPGEAASVRMLGMAADIGTTTLAAYLLDLRTGQRLATASALNPQRTFGADVISRIEHAESRTEHLDELQRSVTAALGSLAGDLVREAGVSADDLVCLTLAGNTTMMHLLAGLPPGAISRAPFAPASCDALTVEARFLGIPEPVRPDALCVLMPSISGYVGADIVAGILATGLHESGDRNRILVDIGTNGEIVLASGDRMYACSTAAGPAFEGANIHCGMGGVTGAIDKVRLERNHDGTAVLWTAIGQDRPRGLCGSGIVDTMAMLLEAGVVDDTGAFADDPSALPPELAARVVEYERWKAFVLVPADEAAHRSPVLFTEKDVREIQNAKAAVRGGIERLMQKAGLRPDQVSELLIAGGFGSFLNIDSAFRIGLLPEALRGRTRPVGNTAGAGAMMALLDARLPVEALRWMDRVEYVELSADPAFMDLYIDAMMFPEA